MKLSKLLLSFLFLGFTAFAVAGAGNGKSHKAKAGHHPAAFSGTDYWAPYTGNSSGAFELGVSNSTILTNTGNWTAPTTPAPDPTSLCSGTTYLCGIIIHVPSGSPPSFTSILSAIKSYYDGNSSTFPTPPSNFNITVGSVTLTVTAYTFDM